MFGQVAGVVVSRVETDNSGRPVAGIGFAIPINAVKSGLGEQVSPAGKVLPTPTPFPTIGPTPDLEATKAAIDAIDAHRREAEQATRSAIEAREEADRYAASLEATRIAELPTPTPEPTPTPPPPTPTPTPHPATFCQEWEALVLAWIKEGNYYEYGDPEIPDHPQLPARLAHGYCIHNFPTGILHHIDYTKDKGVSADKVVGDGPGQLLPGTYEYRRQGDRRVKGSNCSLRHNLDTSTISLKMPEGEPFTFQFFQYHGQVRLSYHGCSSDSALYRIGD